MQTLADELQIIIAGTLLVFVITFFVAVFIIIHQRRYFRFQQDKRDMQNQFEQEILKAELEVREKTFHSIAQEIHDNVGQLLSVIKLNLNMLELEVKDSGGERVKNTKEVVTQVITEMRNLSKQMNSDYIQNIKLAEGLEFEMGLIDKIGTYKTNFNVVGTIKDIPPQNQLIAYRIAQECLQNIMKHANATEVSCQMEYNENQLTIQITDNGEGFDMEEVKNADHKSSGAGLHNISHRAELIDGSLEIDSKKGEGTRVNLSIPIS